MSENLKTLLQQALDMLEEQALHIEAPVLPAGEELLKRIRAAISQQVEPAPAQCPICEANEVVELRMKHCLKCGSDFAGADEMTANKAAVLAARAKRIEPTPAQDEREAVERFSPTTSVPHCGRASEVETYMTEDDDGEYMTVAQHERIVAALTRPAQTGQQPCHVCEDLEPDARRYRTLRQMHWNDGPLAVVANPKASVKLGVDCPGGERLDQMLDQIDEQRYPR